MISILLIILFILVSRIGLYGIFQKAGIEGWKAFVPVLGTLNWLDIIGRSRNRFFLCLIPVVNLFIYSGMAIETALSFGRRDFQDHFLAVAANPYTFVQYGFSQQERYNGKGYLMEQEKPTVKPQWRQWTEAIIFAVFAASFIRMFLIEAYTIPTSSMEGSLLVGDYLFVSKAHYGIRTPSTPLQLPLVHNTIPTTKIESYISWPNWKNYRLPALQPVKILDPVVFNVPEGDTISWYRDDRARATQGRNYYHAYKRDFYDLERRIKNNDPTVRAQYGNVPSDFSAKKKLEELYYLKARPIDKRDNYIKRCVGVPGNTITSRDKKLYIDNKPLATAKNIQFSHQLEIPTNWLINTKLGKPVNDKAWRYLIDDLHLNPENLFRTSQYSTESNVFDVNIHAEQIAQIKKDNKVKVLQENKFAKPGPTLFPHNVEKFPSWTKNDFGPIHLPEEGETIQLTVDNLPLYKRAIGVYENNDLQVKGNDILINGQKATSYTFKQGYYWMMGDNRDGSEDSRYFGMVPHDHIVGKPLFIWMSKGPSGIRWSRLFSGCNKMD